MKYVLDCSVALKTVLPEADSGKAIRLLKEYRQSLHELIAPDIFTPEVANGLATAERTGRIKSGEAIVLLHDIVTNSPVIHPLALAEAEGFEMISADETFIKKMKAKFPFLVRLADLP